MTTVLRVAACVAGCGLLYVAFLVRPDERKTFHHWFDTVWIRADDLHKGALTPISRDTGCLAK